MSSAMYISGVARPFHRMEMQFGVVPTTVPRRALLFTRSPSVKRSASSFVIAVVLRRSFAVQVPLRPSASVRRHRRVFEELRSTRRLKAIGSRRPAPRRLRALPGCSRNAFLSQHIARFEQSPPCPEHVANHHELPADVARFAKHRTAFAVVRAYRTRTRH
jgi:hypothetical protein